MVRNYEEVWTRHETVGHSLRRCLTPHHVRPCRVARRPECGPAGTTCPTVVCAADRIPPGVMSIPGCGKTAHHRSTFRAFPVNISNRHRRVRPAAPRDNCHQTPENYRPDQFPHHHLSLFQNDQLPQAYTHLPNPATGLYLIDSSFTGLQRCFFFPETLAHRRQMYLAFETSSPRLSRLSSISFLLKPQSVFRIFIQFLP